MNPLVRKEIRMLLPAWLAAVIAAALPLWLNQEVLRLTPILFGLAVLALALRAFGLETTFGTFALMLVQPAERLRFWRIKVGLLALAMALVWALFVFCVIFSLQAPVGPQWIRADDINPFIRWSALLTFLAFCSGLWTTILLREMVASFFCAWIVPTVIGGATAALLDWARASEEETTTILFGVLAAYGLLSFFWARHLFVRAEDLPWTGGQINLTLKRGVALRMPTFGFASRQNRWLALAKKELQLQEVTMFLVPALLLMHAAAIGIYHLAPQRFSKALLCDGIPFTWVATVPFIVGCCAIAEERRLGTQEASLCLPVSRAAQFIIKLAIALILGTVAGGMIPWLLLRLNGEMAKSFDTFALISAMIVGLSFYASSLSRGILQAMTIALCVASVAGAFGAYFFYRFGDRAFLSDGALFTFLAWTGMTIAALWLAYRNFQQLRIGVQDWIGNLIRVAAAFILVLLTTAFMYNRTWELAQTLEPPHGPARISGNGRTSMAITWTFDKSYAVSGRESIFELGAVFPDGRLWTGDLHRLRENSTNQWSRTSLKPDSARFLPGSNWVQVATAQFGLIALKSDGTLWRIHAGRATQIGSDSDWSKIAAGPGFVLALKKNGSLWDWNPFVSRTLETIRDSFKQNGTMQEWDVIAHGHPGLSNAAPYRLGTKSDWVDVFDLGDGRGISLNRDGTGQMWTQTDLAHLAESLSDNWGSRCIGLGTNWVSLIAESVSIIGLKSDGTMWAVGPVPWARLVRHFPIRQIEDRSDWIAMNGNQIISALAADGTLWAMRTEQQARGTAELSLQTKRLSKYSDWVATVQYGEDTLALARDGTLSCWVEFETENDWSKGSEPPFLQQIHLGPSRRPKFFINILDAMR